MNIFYLNIAFKLLIKFIFEPSLTHKVYKMNQNDQISKKT